MLASLWQNVVIVNFANAWLAGKIPAPSYRDVPGFEFSKNLSVTAAWDGRVIGTDLGDLFTAMQESGARTARLIAPQAAANPEAINLSAFAGFQLSAVVFTSPDQEFIAQSQPEVLDMDDPERRIWSEHLGVFLYAEPWEELRPGADAHSRLDRSLRALASFAELNSPDWERFFDEALRTLHAIEFPESLNRAFPVSLENAQMEKERRQLLAGASSGWPFGGMGSWNDQSFEEGLQVEFQRLNAELWDALLGALIWASRPLS